jgi:hypothetical protein
MYSWVAFFQENSNASLKKGELAIAVPHPFICLCLSVLYSLTYTWYDTEKCHEYKTLQLNDNRRGRQINDLWTDAGNAVSSPEPA